MTKTKKELLASAPWRGVDSQAEKFKDAKLKVTNQPGATPTMHIPRKSSVSSNGDDDDSLTKIDQELRYSFQRNVQVTSVSLSLSLTHTHTDIHIPVLQ
ncbi:unnamed protein product [Ilex paraguariensis]|uniref:Uncharacterized protein n=1 Tax=Ilex paraguariensis TaxID=185542 RepID=A0ABC8R2H7_9AQUA